MHAKRTSRTVLTMHGVMGRNFSHSSDMELCVRQLAQIFCVCVKLAQNARNFPVCPDMGTTIKSLFPLEFHPNNEYFERLFAEHHFTTICLSGSPHSPAIRLPCHSLGLSPSYSRRMRRPSPFKSSECHVFGLILI